MNGNNPRRSGRRRLLVTVLALAGTGLAPSVVAEVPTVKLRDLYEKNRRFSALAREFDGRTVAVEGYMAPPLKADSTFFVLTRRPMSVCPFCETEAEWPTDILAVHLTRPFRVVPYNAPIVARGVLSLGTETDPDTGFVSRVRLTNARYERV